MLIVPAVLLLLVFGVMYAFSSSTEFPGRPRTPKSTVAQEPDPDSSSGPAKTEVIDSPKAPPPPSSPQQTTQASISVPLLPSSALPDADWSPLSSKKDPRSNIDTKRRDAIKEGMLHAWRGYEQYAWGHDELRPVTNTFNNWLGMGATIVDALDTLWIMDLKDEFKKARDWTAEKLDFDKNMDISVFETTIRALGGLEAAYDLSGDPMFLEKARKLADRLMFAFDTPTGIPCGTLNLKTGSRSCHSWTGFSAVLAEIGTVQLEFRELSHHVGDPKYQEKVDSIIRQIDEKNVQDGLYPLFVDTNSGSFTTSQVSYGALGDSFYEYLLKTHLHAGRNESVAYYRRMYDGAINGMAKFLIQKSDPSGLTYVAEWNGGRPVHKMDELACFVPGMLALGSVHSPNRERDLQLSKDIMETCYKMWERQASGIAPENVQFTGGRDFVNGANYYLLRPETVESLFYLWRFTKDEKYRDQGWKIWEAIQKQCRTNSGYSGLREVSQPVPQKDDSMQSFFLAETLKYLYLLFSEDELIPLNEWVFNTEAHPLRLLTIPHP